MNKKTINITDIIGLDLKSRISVHDLQLLIHNMHCDSVVIDFKNVEFATRSFIDEFYNVFLKSNKGEIELVNVPEDIQVIMDVVKRTQHKRKNIEPVSTENVIYCKSIEELMDCLK